MSRHTAHLITEITQELLDDLADLSKRWRKRFVQMDLPVSAALPLVLFALEVQREAIGLHWQRGGDDDGTAPPG